MTDNTYQSLVQKIRGDLLAEYQARSFLGLFPPEVIGGYELRDWIIRALSGGRPAALGVSGYNPNTITFNATSASFKIYDVNQNTILEKRDRLLWQKMGALPKNLELLASDVAYTANMYLWRGLNGDGDAAPTTQYNFLLDEGSDNGTLLRPNPAVDVAATDSGDWSDVANIRTDVAALVGGLEAKGYNIDTTIVCYPRAAAPAARKKRTDTASGGSESLFTLLAEQGIPANRVIPVDNDFLWTEAPAAPTNALFDLVAFDVTQFVIGYTQEEQILVDGPTGNAQTMDVACDMSFCPLCLPRVINEGGTAKTYKGLGRIKAIVGT